MSFLYYLEKITFGRLKDLDDNSKRLSVRVIDEVLVEAKKLDPNVSSYSNGIVSISYNDLDATITKSTTNLKNIFLWLINKKLCRL